MLIIVGPSAAGKTEIVKRLMKISSLKKLVTYTTRLPRWNEVDGVDYNFISLDDFKNRLENNFFFEYVIYNNNYYGTALNDIVPGNVVILEPNGLKKYVEKASDKIKICYLKCSEEMRKLRMVKRKDQPESIKRRLKNDQICFTQEIEKMADLVVDSEHLTIDDAAKEILDFYEPYSK